MRDRCFMISGNKWKDSIIDQHHQTQDGWLAANKFKKDSLSAGFLAYTSLVVSGLVIHQKVNNTAGSTYAFWIFLIADSQF